MSEGINVKGM